MNNILDSKSSFTTLVDNLSPTRNPNTPHSITSTSYFPSEHPVTAPLLPPPIETESDTIPSPPSSSDHYVALTSDVAQHSTSPTLRDPPLTHLPHSRDSSVSTLSIRQAQEQWNQIVSSSLTALASQFDAASRHLSTEPLVAPFLTEDGSSTPLPSSLPNSRNQVPADTSILSRLEVLEGSQSRLGEDLEGVRLKLKGLTISQGGGEATTVSWKAKEKETEGVIEERIEQADMNARVDNLQSRTEGLESRMEALEKAVEGAVESIKLDQARLYSRLHNATVALNKHFIKAPPMANGKAPQNFPNTKGEFEHLTRERYEHILKSYNLTVKGDINAKREAVREFIGLTPPGK